VAHERLLDPTDQYALKQDKDSHFEMEEITMKIGYVEVADVA